jgi:hypothetical protein
MSIGACCQGHYIEYRGFLSNHKSQLVTALHRLGAPPALVTEADRAYSARLEGADGPTARDQGAEEGGEVAGLLGRRRGFYTLLAHYNGLLERAGSPEALVRAELPGLGRGLACAALHPLLQVGYAGADIRLGYSSSVFGGKRTEDGRF